MVTILLLLTGILLIFVNYKALKKDSTDFKQTFSNATKNVKDYDLEIMKIRSEYAENILEIQQEMEYLKDKLESAHDKGSSLLPNPDDEKLELELVPDEEKEEFEPSLVTKAENEVSNNIKVNEIEKLLKEGLSIDLICEKLGIGKGEVLLIEKLYLK